MLKLTAVLAGAAVIAVLALLVPCIVMDGALLQCGLRTEHSNDAAGRVVLLGLLGGVAVLAPLLYLSELRRLLRR